MSADIVEVNVKGLMPTANGCAVFLGNDHREFWQRTEDRSRQLAATYNTLGLAEYEAIEAFKRYSPTEFLSSAPL